MMGSRRTIVLRCGLAFLGLLVAGPTPAPAQTAPAKDAGKVLSGSFQIKNKKFGDVLRPRGADSADKTPIVLYPRTDWRCLTWRVQPVEGGGSQLLNHFTNKTFEPQGTVKEGDQPVPVLQVKPVRPAPPAQRWSFVPVEGGSFKIVHVPTGWVLTAENGDDGDVRIKLAPWKGRDEQQWQMLDGPTHFSG
jgi:hypothetical protein